MILIPRKLNRRRVLRGVLGAGTVTVALPFLDCFLDSKGQALASGAPLPVRFGTWFWGLGHTPGRNIAGGSGTDWKFHEECAALERFRSQMNFFSGFNIPLDGKPSTVHFTGYVSARTGTVPSRSGEIPAPTLDVLVGDHLASRTRFKSIELACTGNPNHSYSYRGPGIQNTAVVSPLAFYTRIFGPDFADPNAADFTPDPVVMARQSVLSAVQEQSKSLMHQAGAADRARIDEYFTALRHMEQQLALQLTKPPPLEACQRPTAPEDAPVGMELETNIATHKALSELLAMALACNQTHVFNLLLAPAQSDIHRKGAAFTHHILTHEEPPDPKLGYQVEAAKINERNMEAFATFIDALARIREGDGTLLDRTLVLAQTDTSLAKTHSVNGIPVMTVGRAGGRIKTGLHIAGHGDPATRVGLTVMRAMSVPIREWGTGSLQTERPITEILV